MTDAERAVFAAKLDALHEDVTDIKALATATNGKVRLHDVKLAVLDTKFAITLSILLVLVGLVVAPLF